MRSELVEREIKVLFRERDLVITVTTPMVGSISATDRDFWVAPSIHCIYEQYIHFDCTRPGG